MPGRHGPAFSAAEVQTLAAAWPALPLPSRFTRPLRQALILCLMAAHPKLARKVALLSGDGFDRLCEQFQGRPPGDA